MFQFHIGSIKRTNSDLLSETVKSRFNSTLVQLKASASIVGRSRPANVSIPHWFN